MNFRKSLLAVALCAVALATAPAADVALNPNNIFFSTSAKFKSGIAGQTVAAGQLLYQDPADSSKWKLADANVAGNVNKVAGMAANAAVNGQRLQICTEDKALTLSGTHTIGTIYTLSTTPGAIAPSADNASGSYISFVGIVTSATTINFKIVRSDALKP